MWSFTKETDDDEMWQISKLQFLSELNYTHTVCSVFTVNNLATSWLLFCVLRGADWPVLHPSPHQWYLCVVLALPLLSMVPEREREMRKEVETTREREYYTNIAFQDFFWSTTVILMWQQQHNFRHSLCHVFFMLQCHWLTQKCRKSYKTV